MIDHAPRIREEQRRARENHEMEQLEKQTAPLLWMVIVAVVAITLGITSAKGIAFYEEYQDIKAQNELFVRCLNAQRISVDDDHVTCSVIKRKPLVIGMGEQP